MQKNTSVTLGVHYEKFIAQQVTPRSDGSAAMQNYRRLHRLHPIRELYFVHTSRKKPDIREQQWLGIRRANAACSQV
jgi:Bacterial antitoxin of ParD toxin-antitoxin type II system and RHH